MMEWSVDPNSERAPSRQLVDAVLDGIARGELAGGDQLPSVRGLAAIAMVNHNTVARAWRDLEQMGVARGRNGRGVFITPEGPELARNSRQQETLARFEQALAEALRAGHALPDLERIIKATGKRKSA
ncbi:MAG: GntR family transcriptional regulator [Planctomycetota bacterium]|jgi:GntR family transcriptional regulator